MLKVALKKMNIQAYMMIIALIAIWIVFGISDNIYFSPRNISNLMRQTAVTGILAIGMVYVIISGEIDLSVGSAMGLLGGIAAYLNVYAGVPFLMLLPIIVVLGMGIGAFNGAFIAYGKVPSFIVTLAGLLAFRGILTGVTKGESISGFSHQFQMLGGSYLPSVYGVVLTAIVILGYMAMELKERKNRHRHALQNSSWVLQGAKWVSIIVGGIAFISVLNSYQGIPTPVLILGILAIIFTYIARKTVYGRRVYAIGGNSEASRLSGVPIERTKLRVYMLNGMLIAVAALILTSRVGSATPSAGMGAELDAIAACFIGGASMRGGVGTIFGAILGALIMESLKNGMSMMNVEFFWQEIIKGAVLLAAVWFDSYINKGRA